MKIYDEITNEELTSPDLSAGYLYTARRVAEHEPGSYAGHCHRGRPQRP